MLSNQVNPKTRAKITNNLVKLTDEELLMVALWYGLYTGVSLTRDEGIAAVGKKRSARTYIHEEMMRKLF